MFDLAGEAKRLRNSLAVAERWLEAAEEDDETGVLTCQAEYQRDGLEEELSKTAFRMEVLDRKQDMKDARPAPPSSRIRSSAAIASCETRRRRPSAGSCPSGGATRSWGP